MSRIYDNWERLVGATLLREELRLIALRTPSDLSSASSSSLPSPSPSSPSLLARKSFTYDQILQATNNFSRSNLIMYGLTGDLFTGELEAGIQVVVKKVELSSMERRFSLIKELEFYNKVSHPRFVPLLGHCLENKIHKFLVYKYMPHEDLHSFWIYGNSLDWFTRLKMAREIAEGMCFLHHKCDPPLVHRNINGDSILLDDNLEVRLGRLSAVCVEVEEKKTNRNRVSRFLHLTKGSERSTYGILTSTRAFDVYCFGKVLLELVTGNLEFGLSIQAIYAFIKEDSMENTLSYISSLDKKLIQNIVDRSLIINEDLLMEVWAVAFVAKACLHPKPSKRPKMSYVLEALRNPVMVRADSKYSWWK